MNEEFSEARNNARESLAVSPVARLRVGTLLAVKAAVLSGLGMAVLPDFAVGDELADRSLRTLLPGAELAPVTAYALYPSEAGGTPRIEAIVSHLRATISQVRA